MFKDKFQCHVHTFIPLYNGASIPIFIFFYFYLVLIGILHRFFVGAVVSPRWFSTGMKFCKITPEPFIFILQFVNGRVPWMFPANAVHALRRKETITEKSVPRKWCIFSVHLERPFHLSQVMWLYSVSLLNAISHPHLLMTQIHSDSCGWTHCNKSNTYTTAHVPIEKKAHSCTVFSVSRTSWLDLRVLCL